MSSERTWILIFAVTCFLAGLAGGVVLAAKHFPREEQGRFTQYETRMIEYFGLDDEHKRHLRYIIDSYDKEIERLKEHNLRKLADRLKQEGQNRHNLIRDWVIPQNRRTDFDRCALGFPVEATLN